MKTMKPVNFNERLSAAKDAKQALLSKFRQRPGLDDPAVAERRAARAAVSAARDERETKRLADNLRIAAEREALATEQAAQAQRAAAEKEANAAKLENERKAARDARYAARKARQ